MIVPSRYRAPAAVTRAATARAAPGDDPPVAGRAGRGPRDEGRRASAAYRGGVGMLGEMFPGPKIRDEAGEDGDAQKWRLGPIDLERGVVEVHRAAAVEPIVPEPDQGEPPAG
jgi:hypothetical protein